MSSGDYMATAIHRNTTSTTTSTGSLTGIATEDSATTDPDRLPTHGAAKWWPGATAIEHARTATQPTSSGVPGVTEPDGAEPHSTGCEAATVDGAEPRGRRSYPTPGTIGPPRLDRGGQRPACAGRFDLDWDDPADAAQCRALCRRCPVRAECLAQAMENQEPWGIWGGLTTEERAGLARRQARPQPATLPPHGTNRRYCRHGCPCQACKDAHAAYERGQREKRRQREREQSGEPTSRPPGSRWSTQSRSPQ